LQADIICGKLEGVLWVFVGKEKCKVTLSPDADAEVDEDEHKTDGQLASGEAYYLPNTFKKMAGVTKAWKSSFHLIEVSPSRHHLLSASYQHVLMQCNRCPMQFKTSALNMSLNMGPSGLTHSVTCLISHLTQAESLHCRVAVRGSQLLPGSTVFGSATAETGHLHLLLSPGT